ncbi:type I restriction endonuclease [Lysinibacter sp. HNR]|uniref:type I restriction endonuclease n=1 Tax=Lysinibacter sp. HNR TaxID=3031408 RepID=UPI0024359145|nr:type I restriction endonuclease [Lysinibacter sp. HNR]WGD38244.1 type I restriction enzyme HsdR N-terminal domain-containing protein [Lysinibacter sp. HNR]
MYTEITERLASLSTKISNQRDSIETEEATKNAFVMPFISHVLGYDVFNPSEVVPEFTADVGTKKGEKIDYAIIRDGTAQVLIECKKIGEPLHVKHASQLFRYFAAANARIRVLTNGDEYHFFTDLDAPNRMDEKPFLTLTLSDIDATLVPELHKLRKDVFDLESVISAAEDLKYIGELRRVLAGLFTTADEDWVKFLAARFYSGVLTAKMREYFVDLVAKASKQFLNDRINDRLKAAMDDGVPENTEPSELARETDKENLIVTTDQELEGFQVVRAIACSEVSPERIVHRDTQSYFGILLDDNNRKPIARLHFNAAQKYLGLLDENKVETRYPVDTPADIYRFAEQIREATRQYR